MPRAPARRMGCGDGTASRETVSPPNGCTHAPLPCTEPRRSHEACGRLNASCLTSATEYLSSVAGGMTPPRTSMSSDAHLAGCTHQDNLYLEQPHVNPRYSMREQGLPHPLPAGTGYCGSAALSSGDPWGAAPPPAARPAPCALSRRSLEGCCAGAAHQGGGGQGAGRAAGGGGCSPGVAGAGHHPACPAACGGGPDLYML